MKKQQEQGFKLSSQNQLSPIDSSRQNLHSITQGNFNQNPVQSTIPINRVKHVYLQQQNTYGRFVPFLLLKDKLEGELDNSGHTALHHMCSHNSQYLPLYLSTLKMHDQALNRPSKVGHTPLDVAGIYCRKQYVDLLLSKGAIDNGNVDSWAIQGGNIYNWTGHVDPRRKHLIHWAAYNDMPQVLRQFYKQGANINQKDGNDFTPIDLAVINKSYKSIKVLAQLGFRPKQELINQSQSKSIKRLFERINESENSKKIKKQLKKQFIPLFCLLSWFLLFFTNSVQGFSVHYGFLIFTFCLWLALRYFVKIEAQTKYANTRSSQFYSDIIACEVNNKSNHFLYLLLNFSITLTGIITLILCKTENYFVAVLYFIQFYITVVYIINSIILVFGIVKNLTHQQMFDSFKCKYLWKQVHYVSQKKLVVRKFNNPLDRGILQNLKRYCKRNLA